MNEHGIEELIGTLYEMVQDARSVPFSSDKCAVEREKVLDLLDEISNQLPGELKQAKTIVDSRSELITNAKREAENIMKSAQAQARQLVSQEAIYLEAKNQANDMVRAAQDKIKELKKVTNDYVDDSLRRTEEAVAEALSEIRNSRSKFRALVNPQAKNNSAIIEDVLTGAMSRNRILITAVAAALLVVCGIGIFFASNRDHAAERADEWTMQGMTLAPDGSATPCTVRIAGTSRSYLLGGRVGAFETGTDGGIYVDGTRVCSGVILPDDAFDPWLTMQADTDPFWIAADGSTLVLPLPGTQSLVVAPAESEQAAQELLQSLCESLSDQSGLDIIQRYFMSNS